MNNQVYRRENFEEDPDEEVDTEAKRAEAHAKLAKSGWAGVVTALFGVALTAFGAAVSLVFFVRSRRSRGEHIGKSESTVTQIAVVFFLFIGVSFAIAAAFVGCAVTPREAERRRRIRRGALRFAKPKSRNAGQDNQGSVLDAIPSMLRVPSTLKRTSSEQKVKDDAEDSALLTQNFGVVGALW